MRWREVLLPALLAIAPPLSARGGDPGAAFDRAIERRLATLAKTEEILAEKTALRRERARRRVRALYKLSRAGGARVWVDRGERASAPRRRAAVRLLLRRELRELELLREESALAREARTRLEAERAERSAEAPRPASLFRAVVGAEIIRGFGEYEGRESGARLMSRGVELAAHPGRNVRAPERGVVRFAGELRGIGLAVVVAHEGGTGTFTTVLGRLGEVAALPGERVGRGQRLGEAAGDRVYLEIRLPLGSAGFPIDPEPLMEPK